MLILLSFLLLATACRREYAVPREEGGRGSLRLSLRSGGPATKAGEMAEGLAFEDVLVVIADLEGNVKGLVYKAYPYLPTGEDDIQRAELSETPVKDSLFFEDLELGEYQVYAYANTGHTAWQVSGSTIADIERQLVPGTSVLDSLRTLAVLSGTDTPAAPADKMLLTGHKKFFIGVSSNSEEVDLLRPVVRFNVFVHNHTEYELTLKDLSFSNFNASVSYLLGHGDESGAPLVPGGAEQVYRPLPAYDSSAPVTIPAVLDADDDPDDAQGRKLVYTQYLYENRAPSVYRMYAQVALTPDGEGAPVVKDLYSHGVRLLPYEDVAAMQAGDSKQVIFCNPNTNNGRFFGIAAASSFSTIAATYNFEESYFTRAGEMLNWATRDYYVLTLSKDADGRYHLGRPGMPMFYEVAIGGGSQRNGEAGLSLAQGSVPTATDYPISTEFTGYLCRFQDSQHRYLYHQNEKLWVQTGNTARGDRQWAFYEVYPLGSDLRIIDNETSQVKRITYMRRNQELNVVMNVYFEEFDRQFRFEVENTYWSEEAAHDMYHLFK